MACGSNGLRCGTWRALIWWPVFTADASRGSFVSNLRTLHHQLGIVKCRAHLMPAALVVLLAPVVLLVLAALVALAQQAVTVLLLWWRYRHIPGPFPNPWLGNVPELIKRGGSHVAFKHWLSKYGPICKVFFLNRMFVLVGDVDIAHQMMYKLSTRPPAAGPGLKLLPEKHIMFDENGLLFSKGALWRMLRNAWQPAFAPGSLLRYHKLIASSAGQLVAVLSQCTGSAMSEPAAEQARSAKGVHSSAGVHYVDLHELFNSMTLDVVGTCAYGVQFNALQTQDTDNLQDNCRAGYGPVLLKALQDFFATMTMANGSKYSLVLATMPMLAPVIACIARAFPDEPLVRTEKARVSIKTTTHAIIQDWRDHMVDAHLANLSGTTVLSQSGSYTAMGAPAVKSSAAASLNGIQPGSFLSLLLEAQAKAKQANSPEMKALQQLDTRTIAAQAGVFILAGTETTGNTLTYAVYLLCKHPDKLARLLEEVDAHGKDTPLGPDDELQYTDAVIKETMRILPSVHATSRYIDRKEGVMVGPYLLGAGAEIVVPMYTLHRDPTVWPQPEHFIPERWLPEASKELGGSNMNAYMPFGAGPRQCIGYKFAQQEARIALAQVYKQYTFKLKPGQEELRLTAGMTLSPKTGLLVEVVPR